MKHINGIMVLLWVLATNAQAAQQHPQQSIGQGNADGIESVRQRPDFMARLAAIDLKSVADFLSVDSSTIRRIKANNGEWPQLGIVGLPGHQPICTNALLFRNFSSHPSESVTLYVGVCSEVSETELSPIETVRLSSKHLSKALSNQRTIPLDHFDLAVRDFVTPKGNPVSITRT